MNQVLVELAGWDQLTGDGLRTSESFNGGMDHGKLPFKSGGFSFPSARWRAEGKPPDSVDDQPRSVTVVLGCRAAVEAFTNLPVMALR